jgi:alpha-methylacyl-CoA racemase
VLRLVEHADVLFEGYRPGVVERLGLGPDVALARNPKLVYGRMTGWGQYGPLAHKGGHDLNYIGLTGALEIMPESGSRPMPPPGLIGDFGGGGMFLVLWVMCALWEREQSGQGQVIDAAMVDGVALLTTVYRNGIHLGPRPTSVARGGSHSYDVGCVHQGGV